MRRDPSRPAAPRTLSLLAGVMALVSGCATPASLHRAPPTPLPSAPALPAPVAAIPFAGADARGVEGGDCIGCRRMQLSPQEEQHVESRIAALKLRGAPCATYAEVLERSLRNGRITLRPYMWRVGHQLVSGEAYPDGAIFLAREIDPLNVGLRSFDDVVWTMEHEAAHIALKLDAPFDRAPGDRADAVVRECRS